VVFNGLICCYAMHVLEIYLMVDMCRRQQQDEMIERDVIQWLVQLLRNCDMVSDYMMEYAVALLMNLCLRSAGQYHQPLHMHLSSQLSSASFD